MAEELTLRSAGATSAGITFHTGDWVLEALDLGTPGVRDELVQSADQDGAVPFRVGRREAVEWSARIRMVQQVSKDAVLTKLRTLEEALSSAERAAAGGVVDPGVDAARLLWKPEGSSTTGILPLVRAEITERPIEVQGDGAGWFIEMPVVTIGGLRDPFVWGDLAQVVADTVSGAPLAQVLDLPAIGGSVPPWVKVTLEETGSRDRNQITVGHKVNGSEPLIFLPGTGAGYLDPAGFSGTVSSGRLTVTSTEWVGAAAVSGSHSGSYRVVASLVKGGGSIRFRWGTTGDAQTLNVEQPTDAGTFRDLDLGAIDVSREAGGSWTGVIETTGTVNLAGLMLVPMDAWITAETPPGSSALSTKVVDGGLTGSGSLATGNMPLPAQPWSITGTWTRQSGYVERTAVSEGSQQTALAGTSTYSGVRVSCEFTITTGNSSPDSTSKMGLLTRWVDANNHLWAGWVRWPEPDTYGLMLVLRVGGVPINLFGPSKTFFLGAGFPWARVEVSIDTQGYWQLFSGTSWWDPTAVSSRLIAAGQHPALAASGALAAGRVGMFDQWSQATAQGRRFRKFTAHGTPLSTTPILPSGKSLEVTPAGMVGVDGANRRRISHRGGVVQPPPDRASRLLVASRRFNGLAGVESEGKTDNQKVTVHARKRWLQVP